MSTRLPRLESGVWRWASGIALLALLVRLPVAVGQHEVTPGDGPWYFGIAEGLLAGEGFSAAGDYRTPGYPLLIAVAIAMGRSLPGEAPDLLALGQHALGAGTSAALVVLGWRWFRPAVGVVAGIAAAASPVLVAIEHLTYPDLAFGVLAFAGAAVLAEAIDRRQAGWPLLVAAGALFGAAAYLKPAGQFLLVAAPVAWFLATRSLRTAAPRSAVVVATMLLILSPWLIRNAVIHDQLGMSSQGPITLFNRAFEVDRLPLPDDAPYSDLVRSSAESPDQRFHVAAHEALLDAGLTMDEALAVERELASRAIVSHLPTYLVNSGYLTFRAFSDVSRSDERGYDAFLPGAGLQEQLATMSLPMPTALTVAAWAVVEPATQLWLVLSGFGLTALLLPFVAAPRARTAASALLAVWLSLTVGTVLTHGGLWRYSASLAPITWLLGTAGAAVVVDWAAVHVRRRLEPRGMRTGRTQAPDSAISDEAARAASSTGREDEHPRSPRVARRAR